jgi:hypothetical protein
MLSFPNLHHLHTLPQTVLATHVSDYNALHISHLLKKRATGLSDHFLNEHCTVVKERRISRAQWSERFSNAPFRALVVFITGHWTGHWIREAFWAQNYPDGVLHHEGPKAVCSSCKSSLDANR